MLNENGGKTIWYLYFFGRWADTLSKNNQKIYNHCYSCTENNIIYGNETPFALFGILKRAFENDQKFDWLSKIIPYLTEKHFLLQYHNLILKFLRHTDHHLLIYNQRVVTFLKFMDLSQTETWSFLVRDIKILCSENRQI